MFLGAQSCGSLASVGRLFAGLVGWDLRLRLGRHINPGVKGFWRSPMSVVLYHPDVHGGPLRADRAESTLRPVDHEVRGGVAVAKEAPPEGFELTMAWLLTWITGHP